MSGCDDMCCGADFVDVTAGQGLEPIAKFVQARSELIWLWLGQLDWARGAKEIDC